MKKTKKTVVSAGKATVLLSAAAQVLMGAGAIYMGFLTRWMPLLLLGLMQLMPAVVQLILALPKGKEKAQEEKENASRFSRGVAAFGGKLRTGYIKRRDWVVAILAVAALVVSHTIFWRFTYSNLNRLNYLVPVMLAVMFVVSIALELWCKSVSAGASAYQAAQLKGLRSNFMLMRIAYILTIVTSVIRLLDLYDASVILNVLVSILFVYESVFLLFTLVVRAIRKELGTCPEVLVSLIGIGSDTNVLGYLEENTGITMRSLWSLKFIKRLLPGAVLGIALILWLSTGVVQIEAHQQGALFRFGKLNPEPLEPGIHLTLPWPADKVEVYDTDSVQRIAIGYIPSENMDNLWTISHGGEEYRLLLGNGEEVASINLIIEYRISDLVAYISNAASPEAILQAQAYEIVTERTIATNLDTLLAADREVFAASFREELEARQAQSQTGLEVVGVVLESVHPPVEIASAYQDIISAGIDAEYYLLLARTEANRYVMDAKIKAEELVGEATANQHQQVADANSAVAQFLASAALDEIYGDGYRFQKYIQAITAAYGNAKIIIVGEGVDAGNIYIGSLPVATP